jgi:hypothetical protein
MRGKHWIQIREDLEDQAVSLTSFKHGLEHSLRVAKAREAKAKAREALVKAGVEVEEEDED